MRHASTRLVSLLVTGVLLSACSLFSSDPASGPQALEQRSLTVGVGNAIDTAPLRIAVADGAFERVGLRVELVELRSETEGITKLEQGELDVTFATDVALFKAASEGVGLQLQGEAYTVGDNTMALVTLPGSHYDRLMDVPSPTIAVNGIGGLGTLTTTSALETAGVDPAAIDFREWPMPKMVDALRDDEADAAWLVEPFITRAQKDHGARVLVDCARGATQDFPMSAYAASGRFAGANPRTLAAFRDVLSQAQQRGAEETVIRDALPRFSDIGPVTASLVSIGTYPTSLSAVRLQRVADLMHNADLLGDRLDVQSLLPEPRLY